MVVQGHKTVQSINSMSTNGEVKTLRYWINSVIKTKKQLKNKTPVYDTILTSVLFRIFILKIKMCMTHYSCFCRKFCTYNHTICKHKCIHFFSDSNSLYLFSCTIGLTGTGNTLMNEHLCLALNPRRKSLNLFTANNIWYELATWDSFLLLENLGEIFWYKFWR